MASTGIAHQAGDVICLIPRPCTLWRSTVGFRHGVPRRCIVFEVRSGDFFSLFIAGLLLLIAS